MALEDFTDAAPLDDEDREDREREDDQEQLRRRAPSIAGRIVDGGSITGMPPLAPAALSPVYAPAGKSVAGGPAINAPPPPSVAGMAPIVNTPPPETLAQPASVLPGAAPTGPNLAKDVLAGNVPPPQWRDYRPGHVSIGRKILAASLGGLAGLHDPNLGAETTRSIAYGPQMREFAGDTQQFKDVLGAGERATAQRKETLGEELTKAQTAHLGAETDLLGEPKPIPAEVARTYVDENDNEVAIMKDGSTKVLGPAQGKPEKFTNPFEAFAYGTAEQKKAAQDFIAFEKQQGARYEKPGEVEQRYALYQKDPAAFKEMYGNRGGAQEQGQAARMLRFFDGQRKQIQGDFMLGDQEKEQKLAEIQELEKPYLDAAQVGGAGWTKNAGANDNGLRAGEVEVTGPHGEHGYIPRTNLARAIRRGWKQVSQ
jgi:hypothetical protein